ncbi:universal stress protein [Alteromonas halophila]|uniref:Universal stress protein n=1 Tax=Alteromonas halophila TaxID=516698 RepID=A0A918MX37_9ALTE|nr:universal stress protein [Alteromonas halophila]GGW81300.1 universal stress protein [Alteromonas halophila]
MKGHFSNILCVLNDTHEQDEIIEQAIHIAKSHQAKLTLALALEALPPNANIVMESFSYIDSEQSMQSSARQWLEDKQQQWSADYPIKTELCIGQPLLDVVSLVGERDIDLLVKLSDDDFMDRLFGSDDIRLLRKCPCPVWILHRGNSRKYKKVVAALDLNYHYPEHEISVRKALNMDLLRTASQIALLEFAELHIVHVFDAVPDTIVRSGFISVDNDRMEHDLSKIHDERQQELDRLLAQLESELDTGVMDYLQPQRHIVHGYPRREIAATTRSLGADVLVMGTVARLGVPGFVMGGTAEDTIQQIDCALVGIKPRGFVSPLLPKPGS